MHHHAWLAVLKFLKIISLLLGSIHRGLKEYHVCMSFNNIQNLVITHYTSTRLSGETQCSVKCAPSSGTSVPDHSCRSVYVCLPIACPFSFPFTQTSLLCGSTLCSLLTPRALQYLCQPVSRATEPISFRRRSSCSFC